MYVVKDLVPDMKLFYKQYASIEPWLHTDVKPSNNKEHLQHTYDREKLVCYLILLFWDIFLILYLCFRMVCMNVFCVRVVPLHALHIGGILINILDLLCLCRYTFY